LVLAAQEHAAGGSAWRRTNERREETQPLRGTNELPFHLAKALENGVTKDELIEVITHLAFYSGWPTANTAIAIARKAFGELEGK